MSRVDVPAASVHSPAEHVLWTPEHASDSDASFALLPGAASRNLPEPHVEHCVSAVEVPALDVHSPAEQVLCTSHTAPSCSTAVFALGADDRKRPELQPLHCVSLLLVPTTCVHSPALHVAWAVHLSVAMLVEDVALLKNPVLHVSHTGSLLLDPATLVNLPAPHLVWAVHVIMPPWYDARTDPASGLHVNGAYFALE